MSTGAIERRAVVLALDGISVRFGGTSALSLASLHVRAGTIHALLGENGAGKTTLMRVAFGMLRPLEGTLRLRGTPCVFRTSADAIVAGIGMVQQHFLLVPALSVAENVALGEVARVSRFATHSPRRAARRVRELSRSSGLEIDPSIRAGDLPVGAQQRLELLRALASEPTVLILDEPTAVLTPAQSTGLFQWLRAFATAGGAVVLITHKVREALMVADDVTVLRRGATVFTRAAGDVSEEDAIRGMVGNLDHADAAGGAVAGHGETRVSLSGVCVVDSRGVSRLRDADLQVRAGEIVGVVGVEGSGQRELLRVVAGRLRPSSGIVKIPEFVGFVPEDRLRDAVIADWSLVDNVMLAGAGKARGRLALAVARQQACNIVEAFDVRAAGPEATVLSLSGGNQQRFVLGRELLAGATALVVENPVRGLDVRAALQVRARIEQAARVDRTAVLYSSNDADEVLSISDRVVACFSGLVREVGAMSPAAVARAMVGAE